MKTYVDRWVTTGFIISLAILVSLGLYSYLNIDRFLGTRRLVVHTTQVLYHIEQTNSNSVRMEEIVGRFVISGDSTILTEYHNELAKATGHFLKLRELTADNEVQQKKVDSLTLLGRQKINFYSGIIEARRVSRAETEALIASRYNQVMNTQITEWLNDMRAEENRLFEERSLKSQAELIRFSTTLIVLMVVILIILIAVFLLTNKNFQTILESQARTKALNDELEAFTYSVSHDLRAPLRSIRGFSEVIKEDYADKLDPEGQRLFERVMVNASRMGHLIDDLLEFSRVGRTEMSVSRINMHALVSEVVDEFVQTDEKLTVQITLGSLADASGDKRLIKQVWINLISNAIKYTRQTSSPCIEIGCETNSNGVVYFIKDNGIGFDMHYSNKLFQVFQRLHTSKEFEGTGVGLALVDRIVKRHRGRIWTEAAVNKGASFFFTIAK